MPAFLQPLRMLVERGHQVALLFACRSKPAELAISSSWLARVEIRFVDSSSGRELRRKLTDEAVAMMASGRPDFLYLHGEKGSHLWKQAEACGTRCGQRVYGVDDTWRRFRNKPRFWLRMKKPQLFESFSGRKEFVIVTRDGSFGDKVGRLISPHPEYAFHHPLNGFPENSAFESSPSLDSLLKGESYIFCPARFAEMKCKENTLEFLYHLHQAGHNRVRLKVAGQVSSQVSYDRFVARMDRLGLRGSVDFLGTLTRLEVSGHHADSLAVLSLYNFSNLSNVTIEALGAGACLVVIKDGSLEGICDGTNCVMAPTIAGLAAKFVDMLEQPGGGGRYGEIRRRAKATAARFPDWGSRAAWEVGLIEKGTTHDG